MSSGEPGSVTMWQCGSVGGAATLHPTLLPHSLSERSKDRRPEVASHIEYQCRPATRPIRQAQGPCQARTLREVASHIAGTLTQRALGRAGGQSVDVML